MFRGATSTAAPCWLRQIRSRNLAPCHHARSEVLVGRFWYITSAVPSKSDEVSSCGSPSFLVKILPLVAAAAAGAAAIRSQESRKRDERPSLWSSLVCSPIVSHCESNDAKSDSATFDFSFVGVNEEDVDALVQTLLKDPSVNISMVPDALEAQLYKSTILLTLNAIYSLLGGLQGMRLLSHELILSIDRDTAGDAQRLSKALADGTAKSINDEILHEVAARLLANPAVNSPWVPDNLEKQIYFACLQVMFRVTQIILSTFKVRICGHDLTMQLAFDNEGLETAALSAASLDNEAAAAAHRRMTPVDLDLLTSIARQAGVDDEMNTSDYWWNRMFTRSDFVRQLHASLYGLILGILDDLFLGQLKIQILSDTIGFDLVPAKNPYYGMKTPVAVEEEVEQVCESSSSSSSTGYKNSSQLSHSPEGVSSMMMGSFAAGVGVGVTLMAVLSSSNTKG